MFVVAPWKPTFVLAFSIPMCGFFLDSQQLDWGKSNQFLAAFSGFSRPRNEATFIYESLYTAHSLLILHAQS